MDEKFNDLILYEDYLWPIGLEYYRTLCNIDLYSKKQYEDYLINLVSNNTLLKKNLKEFEELVRKKIIILSHTSSNLFSFLLKSAIEKIANTVSKLINVTIGNSEILTDRYTIGVFCNTPKAKDTGIALILKNLTNVLGKTNDDQISRVLMHELTHAFARFSPSFYKVYAKDIRDFYKNLIIVANKMINKEIIDINDKKIIDKINDLSVKLMVNERKSSLDVYKTLDLWINSIYEMIKMSKNNKLDTKETIVYISLILSNPLITYDAINDFSDIIPKSYHEMLNDYSNKLYFIAYSNTFKILPEYIAFGQELVAPSEIICINHTFSDGDSRINLLFRELYNSYKNVKIR